MYITTTCTYIGSKASPTTAPKPRRHKSSTSSDVFDDKESSGLFSSGQRQEGAAGSPARKKVCCLSFMYFYVLVQCIQIIYPFSDVRHLANGINFVTI